jgi:hypothetical protein
MLKGCGSQTFLVRGSLKTFKCSAKLKLLIFIGISHQWSVEQTLGITALVAHTFSQWSLGLDGYCVSNAAIK